MRCLFLLIFIVSCSSRSGQLSEKAKDIEVYANRPQGCEVVGKVVGSDKNGSIELATNDARNQAAKLNASGIHINQEVPNGKIRTVYATAYECN